MLPFLCQKWQHYSWGNSTRPQNDKESEGQRSHNNANSNEDDIWAISIIRSSSHSIDYIGFDTTELEEDEAENKQNQASPDYITWRIWGNLRRPKKKKTNRIMILLEKKKAI